jgi:hypothetical protein
MKRILQNIIDRVYQGWINPGHGRFDIILVSIDWFMYLSGIPYMSHVWKGR